MHLLLLLWLGCAIVRQLCRAAQRRIRLFVKSLPCVPTTSAGLLRTFEGQIREARTRKPFAEGYLILIPSACCSYVICAMSMMRQTLSQRNEGSLNAVCLIVQKEQYRYNDNGHG